MRSKPTILIVEDEIVNRKILNKVLTDSYHIVEAKNGKEAWDILNNIDQAISLVLLDIVMPVMNGYEFLEKIEAANMKDLPIVVMTGDSDAKTEQKVLDAGAWDFVTKPFNVRILKSRIKNALARSQVRMYEEIQHLSEHDALTGLYNRNKMFAETKQMLEENKDRNFAFVRVDIDHFALFNSSFGEEEGDKLLCYCANLLRKDLEHIELCTFGRINADIFAVCFAYENDLTDMKVNVQKGQDTLSAYRQDYVLKFSFGVCKVDDTSLSVEELYLRSSMGVQQCKNQYGKNIGFYDSNYSEKAAQEIEITKEMRTALNENQFVIYLQPKIHLKTDKPVGAEALVRWVHPEKGLISPGVFIPVFERNGFIARLDFYVWEQTCQLMRNWLDEGKKVSPISVNISRISLYNPTLVELLVNLVRKYQLPPHLLQLEITESAYMSNPAQMEDTIAAMHEAGFTILMDDFGSEYSSLNTLKTIDMDVLKVDMKFLPKENDMKKGEIILASVIRMANWLGMEVVVEGVETRRQKDFLEGVNCDVVQGFFYSRPIPCEEYKEKYVTDCERPTKDSFSVEEKEQKYSISILVIDDDEVDRTLLDEYFRAYFHVELCTCVEEGLSYLRRNYSKVKLILVDNVMDGLSGLDFLKYCKEESHLKDIPKIMITANDSVEDQVEAFYEGAYDYITKPLVKEVVMARVNHVMNIHHQLRAFENAKESFRYQVERDEMTGLLNKATFRDMATEALKYTSSEDALMIVDLDDFKLINDNYGHLTGDVVIKIVSDCLKSCLRKTDLIGRFGGDEFLILLSGITNQELAKRKADEIVKTITIDAAKKENVNLTVSVGIAFCEEEDTLDTIFARADQALYDAKNDGKGRAMVYGECVPPIQDDNKPIILICGEDPQIYPVIALAYGEESAFYKIESLEELKLCFEKYQKRIEVVCLDVRKRIMKDAQEFLDFIVKKGGGDTIPLIGVCKEGDMDSLQEALNMKVQDIITLPPQVDVIQRRLSRAIMKNHEKTTDER